MKALGFLVKPYHMERNICEIKTIYNRVKLAFVPIFFTVNSVGGGWESGCMLPGAYGYLALYVGKLCCEYAMPPLYLRRFDTIGRLKAMDQYTNNFSERWRAHQLYPRF